MRKLFVAKTALLAFFGSLLLASFSSSTYAYWYHYNNRNLCNGAYCTHVHQQTTCVHGQCYHHWSAYHYVR